MKRWLATLLLLLAVSPLGADNQTYVNVRNYTCADIEVYIDGVNVGKVWKGYKDCYPVEPGSHKVQTYRASDRWKASLAWVDLNTQYPYGTVWVNDYDF